MLSRGSIGEVEVQMNFGRKIVRAIILAVVFGGIAGLTFAGSSFVLSKVIVKEPAMEPQINVAPVEDKVEDAQEEKTEPVVINEVSNVTNVVNAVDVSDVVEAVMPSIVSITTVSVSEVNMWGRTYRYQDEGAGSGIIVGQDSEHFYILTNRHVVSGANVLTVTFDDDASAEAEVKGVGNSLDIAVVTVDVSALSADTIDRISVAELGESANLKPGQACIAIGNALGYGQSVTVGVVSALNREVNSSDPQSGAPFTCNAIQTDAAINPGNSGGALLDVEGKVIGINSSKLSSTNVEGMGFAIPIDDAAPLMEELISRRVIDESNRGYLGIYGRQVDSSTAAFMGVPTGIAIYQIHPGSPAEEAGLSVGDIVTAFNDIEVRTMDDIQEQMIYLEAGRKVELSVAKKSNGYELEKIEVTLGLRSGSGQ